MMTAWAFPCRLDRRVRLTGVHSAGTTTWTLPFSDTTIDTIVLGPAFGALSGTIITATRPTATTATAAGNYSAGEACLGRAYTWSVEVTKPYVRDGDGKAIVNARIQVRKLVAQLARTGAATIRAIMTSRADRTWAYAAALGVRASVLHPAWTTGNSKDIRLLLESSSPRPVTVPSLEIEVDFSEGMG